MYNVCWGNSCGMLGPLHIIARVGKCDVRVRIETGTTRRTFHRWTHSSLSHHPRIRPFLPRSNSTALLNLFFFVAPPPVPLCLSRSTDISKMRLSCVDCCQMFRLSDLSSDLSFTLFFSRQIKRRCVSIRCYLMRDLQTMHFHRISMSYCCYEWFYRFNIVKC